MYSYPLYESDLGISSSSFLTPVKAVSISSLISYSIPAAVGSFVIALAVLPCSKPLGVNLANCSTPPGIKPPRT